MSLTAYTAKTWVDYADSPDLSAANVQCMDSGIAAVTAEVIALEASLPTTYQPISAELSALAGLSTAGYAKRGASAGSWGIVTSIPQTDVTGLTAALASIPLPSVTSPAMNGTAAIGALTTRFALADHVHPSDTAKLGASAQAVDSAKLGGQLPVYYATASSLSSYQTVAGMASYSTKAVADTLYQPLDADLTAIAALGTTGFVRRTAANTWAASAMAWADISGVISYGAAAGTVAQGNDSRIVNGQTAYGWGNHASAGYLTSASALDPAKITQTSSYRFVTDTEKSTWNGKQNAITTGTTAQYLRGNLSLATFPTTWDWSALTGVPTTFTPSTHTHSLLNITDRNSNYIDSNYDVGTAKLLRWKNYTNHMICDMSAGTAPDGTSHSKTDCEVAWAGTFPTIMGWNGANTYGVRVDRARCSDFADSIAWSGISGKPTTLSGYGITDAATSTHSHPFYVQGQNGSRTTEWPATNPFSNISYSGFFNSAFAPDSPVNNTWTHLIHSDYTDNDDWSFDIAANFMSGNAENYFMRVKHNNVYETTTTGNGWRKLWHDGNFDPATTTALAKYLPLTGGTLTGALTVAGAIIPDADISRSLGSVANRWLNVYAVNIYEAGQLLSNRYQAKGSYGQLGAINSWSNTNTFTSNTFFQNASFTTGATGGFGSAAGPYNVSGSYDGWFGYVNRNSNFHAGIVFSYYSEDVNIMSAGNSAVNIGVNNTSTGIGNIIATFDAVNGTDIYGGFMVNGGVKTPTYQVSTASTLNVSKPHSVTHCTGGIVLTLPTTGATTFQPYFISGNCVLVCANAIAFKGVNVNPNVNTPNIYGSVQAIFDGTYWFVG